jgi:NAD(P)-dependent dehydrogenase (short-subunit alcohol dehydrogenase family)
VGLRHKPISEQVVVLVGGSSGIGRETAKQFALRGARVVVAARGEEKLESLIEEINEQGGKAVAVPANAADPDDMQMLARKAVDLFGRIDTWVNLAAVSVYATFEQTTPDEFRQIMDVNLLGQIYATKAALPYLKKQGGALVCVSSAEANRAIPYHSAYAASKHGVKGFVDALRVELQHEGAPVTVTNVMPASVNTPFFETARTKLGVRPRGMAPVYEPEVVARTILYAAEHGPRDLYAGGAAKLLTVINRLSPSVGDTFFRRFGMKAQRTDVPKSALAPDNLYHPLPDEDRVHGAQGAEAREFSLYTWLEIHPAARIAATGMVVAALAFVGIRRGLGIRG